MRFRDQTIAFKNGANGHNFEIPTANPLNYFHVISRSAELPKLTIDGKLFLPPTDRRKIDGKWPLVMVVPGSLGVAPSHVKHAETLVDDGFAAFVLDSFGARDVTSTVANQTQFSFASSAYDVLAAWQVLSAARGARSRCGPTCGWPAGRRGRRRRCAAPAGVRRAGRRGSWCAPGWPTSASCSRPATCARWRTIRGAILAEPDGAIRDCLLLALTGALAQGSRMMADHGRDGGGASWKLNIYWLPERSLELDPFRCFANRLQRVVAAKRDDGRAARRRASRRGSSAPTRATSRRTCPTAPPPTPSPTRRTAARASSTRSCRRCGAPGSTRRSSPRLRGGDRREPAPRAATATHSRPACWTVPGGAPGAGAGRAHDVTFASRDPRSWRALDAALAGAGFRVEVTSRSGGRRRR